MTQKAKAIRNLQPEAKWKSATPMIGMLLCKILLPIQIKTSAKNG